MCCPENMQFLLVWKLLAGIVTASLWDFVASLSGHAGTTWTQSQNMERMTEPHTLGMWGIKCSIIVSIIIIP